MKASINRWVTFESCFGFHNCNLLLDVLVPELTVIGQACPRYGLGLVQESLVMRGLMDFRVKLVVERTSRLGHSDAIG
jgi:hypothetical protein